MKKKASFIAMQESIGVLQIFVNNHKIRHGGKMEGMATARVATTI